MHNQFVKWVESLFQITSPIPPSPATSTISTIYKLTKLSLTIISYFSTFSMDLYSNVLLFHLQFSPSLYSPNWLNFSDGYHGLSSTHPHRHLSNIHQNVKSHTRLFEFINWDKSHATNCPYTRTNLFKFITCHKLSTTHSQTPHIYSTDSDAKVLFSPHTRLFIACHGLSLTNSHVTQQCFGALS